MLGWTLKHKLITLLISLFVLLWLFISLFLQPLVKNAIADYTKPYGIEKVELQQLGFNPFNGKVSIEQLNLYQADTETAALTIGQLNINLSISALLAQRLLVQSVTFADSQLPFQLKHQQLFLADIPLTSEKPADESESKGLLLLPGLTGIYFENIELSLSTQQNDQTQTLNIDELSLTDLYAWSDDYGLLKLKTRVNQQPINATFKLYAFQQAPKIVGTLKADRLDLAQFNSFIEPLVPDLQLDAKLSTDITFTVQQTPDGFEVFNQGNINIDQAVVNYQGKQLSTDNLSWKGDIYLTQTATAEIRTDGQFSSQNLQLLADDQKLSWQKLTLSGQSNTLLTAQPLVKINQQLKIQLADFSNADIKLTSDLNANLKATINSGQQQIAAQGQLNLQNLTTAVKNSATPYQADFAKLQLDFNQQFNYQNQQLLARIGKLQLDQLNLAYQNQSIVQNQSLQIRNLQLNEKADLQLDSLELKKLSIAGSKANTKDAKFIDLKQLQLQQVMLKNAKQGKNLSIDKVALTGSELHLTLTEDNRLAELDALMSSLGQSTGQSTEKQNKTAGTDNNPKQSQQVAQTEQTNNFNYQIKQLLVTGDNRINFITDSFTPAISKQFRLNEFSLQPLDSKQPDALSQLNLNIQLDEFSKLTSKGQLSVLNPKHKMQLTTDIDGMSLVQLSPFMESQLGYQIDSGQLSAQLSTDIENSVIDAKNELQLNKLILQNSDSEQAVKARQKFALPLDTGLSLLKDKNDNIELSLPIKGDINSPDFDINDVVTTALSKAMAGATRTYLLFALQPFGAIAMAGEFVANQAGAITLQPVDFAPGRKTLSKPMQDYMSKIKTLLAKRPGVQIKLCQGASEADRQVIQQALTAQRQMQQQAQQNTVTDNQQAVPLEPIKVSDQQLLELASERQAAIKRYLTKAGVKSKQLVICKPKIGKQNKQAQVLLQI